MLFARPDGSGVLVAAAAPKRQRPALDVATLRTFRAHTFKRYVDAGHSVATVALIFQTAPRRVYDDLAFLTAELERAAAQRNQDPDDAPGEA